MVGGYPGTTYRRELRAEGKLEADFTSFGARVTDVNDVNFSIPIPLADSFSVSSKLIPPNEDLSGISGGGVYRVVETFEAGRLVSGRLDLIGIIYFGSPGWEVLVAHPLNSLKRNGEFNITSSN
jgi:hypothetical protein